MPEPSKTPLSGRRVRLAADGYEANIASVGATLRTLSYRGRELVRPFEADELRPHFAGAILAPWPNRVTDAAYAWDGEERQLDVSEPERGNALHGLMAWQEFEVVESSNRSAALRAVVEPRKGYPHRVELVVRFTLARDGLTTRVQARLLAGAAAPFGTGPHPYLVAPGGKVDDWVFSLPAATIQDVELTRMVPTGLRAVAGSAEDFTTPRTVGETFIDHAYTDLTRDEDGLAHVLVTDAAGVGTRMSWDAACPWVQVHTADQPVEAESRTGLAVEPMTCPPGAFNSGTDVIRLEPGESTEASWTIGAVGGA